MDEINAKDIYKLDDSWAYIKTIIPFGYGRVGKKTLLKLMEMFSVLFVIDNNPDYTSVNDRITIYGIIAGLFSNAFEYPDEMMTMSENEMKSAKWQELKYVTEDMIKKFRDVK